MALERARAAPRAGPRARLRLRAPAPGRAPPLGHVLRPTGRPLSWCPGASACTSAPRATTSTPRPRARRTCAPRARADPRPPHAGQRRPSPPPAPRPCGTGCPARRHARATSAHRLHHAGLVVGPHQRAQRHVRRSASSTASAAPPVRPRRQPTTSAPCFSRLRQRRQHAGCSIARGDDAPTARIRPRRKAPLIASASASEPEPVKHTSFGSQPSTRATCARAASSRPRASRPRLVHARGFPRRHPPAKARAAPRHLRPQRRGRVVSPSRSRVLSRRAATRAARSPRRTPPGTASPARA